MSRSTAVHVGFEVGTGNPVTVPVRHMAVTGQTQESGKTTTLEALVSRLDSCSALAFITKRGEQSFAGAQRIQPYFRDRADWQFVTSILDATLQEKNKFLRPWIMKICRTTKSLADVQRAVRKALETAKGINEGVYTQLDAYLDLIVPEIQRARLATTLEIDAGLSVMDLGGFSTPMQMLFVQSAIDWINDNAANTIVIVPEAWEFIPEGKGSPVKSSAVTLVRKGAGIGNRIWVDSQDMAGVDKTILRGCAVWMIGVQREANEIKRNLANIPASIKRPTAAAVAELTIGQFYVCYGSHAIKTYVQPAWMTEEIATAISLGNVEALPPAPKAIQPKEVIVNEREARELREQNEELKGRIRELEQKLGESSSHKASADAPRSGRRNDAGDAGRTPVSPSHHFDEDQETLYRLFKARLIDELPKDPTVMRIVTSKPELRIEVERQIITVDGKTVRGRIARMIADGFFPVAKTSGDVFEELKKTGSTPSNIELGNAMKELVEMGFFTRENKWYTLVPAMTVNVIQR